MSEVNAFTLVGHVDPPPDVDIDHPGLIHYIGPRKFPGGVYMPKGYDLESRPGETEGWIIYRARDTITGEVFTMWATGPVEGDMTSSVDLME